MKPVLSEVEGRSEMREVAAPLPDSASLHPGYAGSVSGARRIEVAILFSSVNACIHCITKKPDGLSHRAFLCLGIGMSLNLANLGGPVARDFSAQLEFRNAHIPGTGLDQVELATGYANGSIFFNVRDNSNGNLQ